MTIARSGRDRSTATRPRPGTPEGEGGVVVRSDAGRPAPTFRTADLILFGLHGYFIV